MSLLFFFLPSTFYVHAAAAAAAAKSLQLCPTLCDPIDGSQSGSPIPGILQAGVLEWAAISFSNAWKWKAKVKLLSHVWLLVTPWTAAYQAPPQGSNPNPLNWAHSLNYWTIREVPAIKIFINLVTGHLIELSFILRVFHWFFWLLLVAHYFIPLKW